MATGDSTVDGSQFTIHNSYQHLRRCNEMPKRFTWRLRATFLLLILIVLVASSFMTLWRYDTISTTNILFVDNIETQLPVDKPTTTYSSSPFNTTLYNVIGPDKNRNCRRPCDPSLHNRIVYTCLHPAGLLDRQELLDNLLELASFLCATLEFPTPTQSFHPMHNHQQLVDTSLDWSDFFQFSLVDVVNEHEGSLSPPQPPKGLPVDTEHHDSNNRLLLVQSVTVTMDPSFYMPWNTKPQSCRRPRAAPDRRRESYGLHILSKSQDEVLTDFHTIRRYSFEKQHSNLPFLWEIPTNFYSFHHELRRYLRSQPPHQNNGFHALGASCLPWSRSGRYARRSIPPHIQSTINDIWNTIVRSTRRPSEASSHGNHDATVTTFTSPPPPQPPTTSTTTISPLIGFLHIRRGDTIEECDTSVSKLRLYLSCSFSKMSFANSTDTTSNLSTNNQKEQNEVVVTLLVGTNEQDSSYMQDLQVMVRDLVLFTVDHGRKINIKLQAVDVDSLIRDHLQLEVNVGRLPSAYLNNLHVFQILEHIMNHLVDFKLVQRRFRYCNDCDAITIQRSLPGRELS
jgi:hypothetical protein